LAEKLVSRLASNGTKAPHETLSDREYHVVRMIASGKTIKEIGKELFLSVRTVSTYRARALEKMNMKTNAELTRYALEHKLID
jgi:DNA-binding NarL/FixJ family response regulator